SAWLAQANHIFNSLGIRLDLDHYGKFRFSFIEMSTIVTIFPVFVYRIQCKLRLLDPLNNLPPGYLFLCSLALLETEVPGCFGIPDAPAYWSRDPLGVEHLSAEEAKNEGFPDIEFRMWARGRTWDDRVYTGVRQFHQAKGFDPYSPEVATELGYPLFQASCEQDDLFEHFEPTISIAVDSSDGLTVQKSDTDNRVPTNDDIGSSEQYGALREFHDHENVIS
ncbi:hypothetical protein B0H19DRAFT_1325506, partial [Mycena capillaripes]